MSNWFDDDPNQRRDVPLSCVWRTVTPDAFDDLRLPQLRSRAADLARAPILTEACVVARADPDAWLSYSRRKAWYAARCRRYLPTTFTYSTIPPAVDQLTDLGWLDHEKAAPGTLRESDAAYRPQSRFKASDQLLRLWESRAQSVVFDPQERIVLRDGDGNIIDYDDTTRTRRQRRNLAEINEELASAALSIAGQQVREGEPLGIGNHKAGAAKNTLHRVFNRGSFSRGGRFYGGWWQNIPSDCRADIEIDGVPTVEHDYGHLHPTLLYAEVGRAPDGDPYDIAGWPRDLVKVAFNTLVNADTTESAVRSIAQEIGGKGSRAKAEHLVAEIKAKHITISDMFGTGAGLRLQRTDSDMAELVLLRLLKQGVTALPVHDSFLVQNTGDTPGLLDEIMDETLEKFVQNNPVFSITSLKKVPQYGETGADGSGPVGGLGPVIGAVLVLFPDLPQHDMFDGHKLSVLKSEIAGWNRGVATEGVRTALRHEMKRRNLTHDRVAKRLGVSRPQFENILQGRFGASTKTATAIRQFLAAEI